MITYPEIYDILRKEKYTERLQDLKKDFLNEVETYLREKKALLERERKERPQVFADTLDRTRKQLENAKDMVREIFARRERKISELALVAARVGVSKSDLANMLEHEKKFFEAIVEMILENEKSILKALDARERDDINMLIKFKERVSSFVDLNENELGPFEENDVANLPKKIADVLVKGNKAEVVRM